MILCEIQLLRPTDHTRQSVDDPAKQTKNKISKYWGWGREGWVVLYEELVEAQRG